MITDDDMVQAFDRVARTADGAMVYFFLQKIMMGVVSGPDPAVGALYRNEGRRSLAAELMGLMAKGIDDSGGWADDTTGDGRRSQRPIVFVARRPANVGRHVSIRDHIRANDPELKQPKSGDD